MIKLVQLKAFCQTINNLPLQLSDIINYISSLFIDTNNNNKSTDIVILISQSYCTSVSDVVIKLCIQIVYAINSKREQSNLPWLLS